MQNEAEASSAEEQLVRINFVRFALNPLLGLHFINGFFIKHF